MSEDTRSTFNPHGYPTADWLAADPARRLAEKIQTYWAIRGQTVHATVKQERGGYVIRSDMRDGKPKP